MKTSMWIVIALFAVLAVSFAAAQAPDPQWDRSTLVFNISSSDCGSVTARFCNNGSDMNMTTSYNVYFAESGNPKEGTIVASGSVPMLNASECVDLTYYPGTTYGNYMFQVFQNPWHPGTGELWSDAIGYENCQIPEFGVIAASVAMVGALGALVLFRRR